MMMNEKKQLEQFREQSEDFKKNLPNNFKFIDEFDDEEKSEIFTKICSPAMLVATSKCSFGLTPTDISVNVAALGIQ